MHDRSVGNMLSALLGVMIVCVGSMLLLLLSFNDFSIWVLSGIIMCYGCVVYVRTHSREPAECFSPLFLTLGLCLRNHLASVST